MQNITFKSGKWLMQAVPADGARITRLAYDGFNMLAAPPKVFRPPQKNYGRYETRPVYGYDDCFPSVDSCRYPDMNWRVPDHGELCWLPWDVTPVSNGLRFAVQSRKLPLEFSRTMTFQHQKLTWQFEVLSRGGCPLPFQHVMHALMPLDKINPAGLELPVCEEIYDEANKQPINGARGSGLKVRHILQETQTGEYKMLILRGIKTGEFTLAFKNGPNIRVEFTHKYFPSLGIWWNNHGYPDESGLRRRECAFEPIPGPTSSLTCAVRDNQALSTPAGSKFNWSVTWGCKTNSLM